MRKVVYQPDQRGGLHWLVLERHDPPVDAQGDALWKVVSEHRHLGQAQRAAGLAPTPFTMDVG